MLARFAVAQAMAIAFYSIEVWRAAAFIAVRPLAPLTHSASLGVSTFWRCLEDSQIKIEGITIALS